MSSGWAHALMSLRRAYGMMGSCMGWLQRQLLCKLSQCIGGVVYACIRRVPSEHCCGASLLCSVAHKQTRRSSASSRLHVHISSLQHS
eukprot:188173-Chlamydomonas_euryale.AAC.4